ncbi:hypothetical protein STEG23_024246 [Scotinomys teguina]
MLALARPPPLSRRAAPPGKSAGSATPPPRPAVTQGRGRPRGPWSAAGSRYRCGHRRPAGLRHSDGRKRMRMNVQAQHHQMAAEVAAPYITRISRRARGSGALHHADIKRTSCRARGSGTLRQRRPTFDYHSK